MVPEAPLEQTSDGLVPAGEGWFVLNAREARWRHHEGRGNSLAFTGSSDFEAETYFPQLGAQLIILGPGEPIGLYHWEDDQEGFLILSGEALLLIEGQERPLRQWDYVHCPPKTRHVILGAGAGPCTLLGIGSRTTMATPTWGAYVPDPVAARHGVSVEEETSDSGTAYARYPATERTAYRDGWLP